LNDVKDVMIWGNHSSTQYPDTTHATVQGKPVDQVIPKSWLQKDFVSMIQTRGAAIINARKASSALSAARAITNHVHDWIVGTDNKGELVSMAVFTDGSDGYNIEKGLIYSFPVSCSGGGNVDIKKGLPIDGFSQQRMKETEAELIEERELAFQLVN